MGMMKKLTSALVASSLVLSLVGTAAATTPDKINAAADRMAALGLVQGKGGPDLALGDSITRAELVTVIVRAFGQESNAKYLTGVARFSDTANHWASGYIAMADKLIAERSNGTEVVGYPDGTFKPDAQVTAAEAIAFLMKFVGAPADASLAWPDNYLQGAVNAGLITAEDLANIEGIKNAPATRGLAFYLADTAFAGYKLAEGNTVYRTFVDTVGPALSITTQAPAEPTLASKITITGTVSDAVAVFVGTPDNAATITDGTFTIDVDLAMGENNIVVTAVDMVGNTTEKSIKVTRTAGPAAAIQAEDITVAAGETVEVAAAVVDEVGNVLEGHEITGESNVGTYADGKFTAGTKAGEGTLTLKSGDFTKEVKVTVTPGALYTVKAASSFAPGEPVQLVGVDAYGNVIPGVTFSEDSADAYIEGDRLIVTKEGTYTITGTLGDVVVTGTVGAYGDVEDIAIEVDKKELVANNASTVTVTVKAVDVNGNVVTNFDGYARYEGYLVVDDEDDYLYTDSDGEEAVVELKDGVATFVLKAADVYLADEDVELEFGIYEEYSDAKNADDAIAEGEVTIEVVEQEATAFKLDAPDYLTVNMENAEAKVKILVLDQDGEEMLEGDEYDFKVKVEGPAYMLDDDDDEVDTLDFDDEYIDEDGFYVYIYPEDDDETGTVTVTVTSKNLKSATATIKAAIAGRARGIELDSDDDAVEVTAVSGTGSFAEYGEYEVQLVDRKGVPTSNEDDVKITVNVSGAEYIGAIYVKGAANDVDGNLSTKSSDWQQLLSDSFTVIPDADTGKATFYLATSVAQTIELSAEDEDDELSDSNTYKVAFEAGKPAKIAIKGHADANSAGTMYLVPEKKATVVAQLYDAYNNPVSKAGYTVKVAGNSSLAAPDDVKVNGKTGSKVLDLDLRTDKNGQVALDIELDDDATAGESLYLKVEELDNVSAEITLNPEYDVAHKVDIQVVDAATKGNEVTAVTPGKIYYLEVKITDDDGDPIELASAGAYRISSSADVEWKDNSRTSFKVPASLDVSRITFKVELFGFAKTLSDTDSVKLAAPSTYKFTVEKPDVIEKTTSLATVDENGKVIDTITFESNAKVTLAADKVGDFGYEHVCIEVSVDEVSVDEKPANDAKVRLIAKDTNGVYWDIATTRKWGPSTGFEIGKRYSETTPIMAQFNTAGVYKITFKLVDLDNNREPITSATVYVTVVN